ncbi:hypothetical protein [Deinococcus sp. YIM 77859]|uniref:hypothetical protein n=1 Tax=Deinococcus sp. YIM 77859 TaxID=1540221 RepID=UPI0005523A43|nr:hypothetical protein [Deinococcus sp. YIM 77859]
MKNLLSLLLLASFSSAAALSLKDVHPDDLCTPTALVYVDGKANAALARDMTAALQRALQARGVKWSTDKSCAITLTYGLEVLSSNGAYLSTLELAANGAHIDTVKTLLGETLEADLDEDYLILDQDVEYGRTATDQLGRTGQEAIAGHVKSMLR